MTELRTWIQTNSTLVYFLIAQALAIGTAGVSILTYMVRLENRVATMETRGAAYTVERLTKVDDRLTILEQRIAANQDRIERIVDILTKQLPKGDVP
jgi:uncharacterized coiled-coil protein SlyX